MVIAFSTNILPAVEVAVVVVGERYIAAGSGDNQVAGCVDKQRCKIAVIVSKNLLGCCNCVLDREFKRWARGADADVAIIIYDQSGKRTAVSQKSKRVVCGSTSISNKPHERV